MRRAGGALRRFWRRWGMRKNTPQRPGVVFLHAGTRLRREYGIDHAYRTPERGRGGGGLRPCGRIRVRNCSGAPPPAPKPDQKTKLTPEPARFSTQAHLSIDW